MDYLSFGLRLWLALVCAVAVVGKVRSRRSFAAFVASLESAARAVPMVTAPARFAARTATPVLAAEIAVAVLLPFPGTAVVGGVVAVAVFGVFTAGVALAVVTGTEASCACFGRITTTLGWPHVARNMLLLAGAGTALGIGAGPVDRAGGLSSAVAAVVATLLIVFWSDIAAALSGAELSEVEVPK